MKKDVKVYFRSSRQEEEELNTCSKYFEVSRSRMGMENCLVIGRYSVLPFYRELESDLKYQGSTLINSFMEHDYIASFDWYFDVSEYTPKTYFSLQDLPKNGGPFVVKGKTNSRKQQWREKMFAKNYEEAVKIYLELQQDPLISDQGVIFRDYIPLESFGESINGQPFANEWRMFFYKKDLLSYGYYWVSGDYIPKKEELPEEAISFANEVAEVLSQRTNFFVIDIAKTKEGKWILIEVNDGQLSGLSDNSAEELYANLKQVLTNE